MLRHVDGHKVARRRGAHTHVTGGVRVVAVLPLEDALPTHHCADATEESTKLLDLPANLVRLGGTGQNTDR